tara:strand:+ start:593 stop:1171 length:579 start_codon:yes stop_codon:yes gene_type:complete
MLDLSNKSFCIFGLPDSGKSTLAHFIIKAYGVKAFIFDTLNEFNSDPYDSYTPATRGDIPELEKTIRAAMASRRYSMILIDEANRYCPSKPSPLPQAVADLNDFRAHYKLAVGFIARRPVQLNQDLTELAHFLFIFNLPGKNDSDYLNSLAAGLGDAAARLPKYHYLLFDRYSYQVYAPVPKENATQKTRGA